MDGSVYIARASAPHGHRPVRRLGFASEQSTSFRSAYERPALTATLP